MDRHGSLSVRVPLQADVVFKIPAYYFQNLEIFFRKFLTLLVRLLLWFGHLLDLLFKLPYGHVVLYDEVAEILLKLYVFNSEQYLCMSHAEQAYFQVMLDLCRKLEQAQEICYGRPFLADSDCHLFLGEAALFDKPLVAHGDFDRIEIFPLDVLDDRHLQHPLVICIPDICRYHIHAGHLAGSEPTLTADDLVSSVRLASYCNRLYQAKGSD